MRLAAGLHPDPLRELTALPRPPSWILWKGLGRGRKGIRTGEGREMEKGRKGGEGRGGEKGGKVFTPTI